MLGSASSCSREAQSGHAYSHRHRDHAARSLKNTQGSLDEGRSSSTTAATSTTPPTTTRVLLRLRRRRHRRPRAASASSWGGSGNGEQIAANKVVTACAPPVWSVETAMLARCAHDANVAGFGVRQHSADDALTILDASHRQSFSEDVASRQPQSARCVVVSAPPRAPRWGLMAPTRSRPVGGSAGVPSRSCREAPSTVSPAPSPSSTAVSGGLRRRAVY